MPYQDGRLHQIIQFTVDKTCTSYCFEGQQHIPCVDECVVIYDQNHSPVFSGKVTEVKWCYIESYSDSVCMVTLKPLK
jgi:hypothetical protein